MAQQRRSRRAASRASADNTERGASAYETLKQAILRGELSPGQPLVETTLATWCGVSRTPIREALTRLTQDGLVDRTDHGMVVKERSPEEILDVYGARVALEAAVAQVAAERRSEYDLRLLRRILQRAGEADPADPHALVEVNQQFHRAVWRASHNKSLQDLLERLELHLGRYPFTTLSYPGRWATACAEHAELVDSIEARDGERAYQIAHQHFTEARDIRLELYDRELS